jgi:hypothetical protein
VLLLRIVFILSLISLAVAGAMYFYTRDRRYLRFIFQVVKYVVFIMLGVFGFMALERFAVIL